MRGSLACALGVLVLAACAAPVAEPFVVEPLPPVTHPPDNPWSPEKAELGRMLFFDPRMSGDGSTSCATCHDPSDGGWTVHAPVSPGYPGTTHWRNSQSLVNAAYASRLNWDGAAKSLEQQARKAWTSAIAGNVDTAMAEERLAQVPEYVARFRRVFGTTYPQFDDALKAVATYERTIVSGPSPADRYAAGDDHALSAAAVRGMGLFAGRAGCAQCHRGPLLNDGSYHDLGVPQPPDFHSAILTQVTVRWEFLTKGVPEDEYMVMDEDWGLYYVTKSEGDRRRFRTPSLRDACYSAPYMHSGVLATLSEVVAFYSSGGGDGGALQPLGLTAAEQRDLVAFLEALCGAPVTDSPPELPPYAQWSLDEESQP